MTGLGFKELTLIIFSKILRLGTICIQWFAIKLFRLTSKNRFAQVFMVKYCYTIVLLDCSKSFIGEKIRFIMQVYILHNSLMHVRIYRKTYGML